MAHVEIKFKKDGTGFVGVDGVAIPALADGFNVDFSGPRPVVQMRVVADVLDVDLPNAVVEAMRAEASV